MIHRLRRPWLVAPCIALACVAIAGCAGGSGSPSGAASGVAVTLTAPTSGAVVGVHQIQVVGTVTPSNAVVKVAGQPASVNKGRFNRVLWLQQPTTTIQITAAASGHATTTVTTTVHFSASLAVALIAARNASIATTSRALDSVASPSAIRASRARIARHRAAASTTTTATTSAATTPAGTSAPGSTTTTTTTTSTSTSPSGSGSNPAPITPRQIQYRYLRGCSQADGGQSAVPYCTCMYNHLLRAGALASPATIASLENALEAYQRTQNIFALPVFLRLALSDCASQLPVPPLTITKLPPLKHRPTPPKATAAQPAPVSSTARQG